MRKNFQPRYIDLLLLRIHQNCQDAFSFLRLTRVKNQALLLTIAWYTIPLFLTSCSFSSVSFQDSPVPVLTAIVPRVAASGARIALVGNNFDLTPEDPNDLPGSQNDTPFTVTVTVGDQELAFSAEDVLASTFLTIRLPDLAPGEYPVQVSVNGQNSGIAFLTIDTITEIVFAEVDADPVIFPALGGGHRFEVFGIAPDGEVFEVTEEIEFESDPPDALSIGASQTVSALRSGSAVLVANRGALSTEITVRTEADGDFVSELLTPASLFLAPGELAALPLSGQSNKGRFVDLAPSSRITIQGDEAVLPIFRDRSGRPFIEALGEGEAIYTFSVGDNSLEQVSIVAKSEVERRANLEELSLLVEAPLFSGGTVSSLLASAVYDIGPGPVPEAPLCEVKSGKERLAIGLEGVLLGIAPGKALLSCEAGGGVTELPVLIEDDGDRGVALTVNPLFFSAAPFEVFSVFASLETQNGNVIDVSSILRAPVFSTALLAAPALLLASRAGFIPVSVGPFQADIFLDTNTTLDTELLLSFGEEQKLTSLLVDGENVFLAAAGTGSILALEENGVFTMTKEVAGGLSGILALSLQEEGKLISANAKTLSLARIDLQESFLGDAPSSGALFHEIASVPTGVASTQDGVLFASVSDGSLLRISQTGEISVLANDISLPVQEAIASFFPSTTLGSLAYDEEQDILYLLDRSIGLLYAIDSASTISAPVQVREVFSLPGLISVSLGKEGLLILGSRLTGAILFLSSEGTLLGGLDSGVGPQALQAVSLSEDGSLYVLENKENSLLRIRVNP